MFAFPLYSSFDRFDDATMDYLVTDKWGHETLLDEEMALACRYNLLVGKLEYFPGSYRPYHHRYPKSSVLGEQYGLYKKLKLVTKKGNPKASFHWDLTKRVYDEPESVIDTQVHFLVFLAHKYIPSHQDTFSSFMDMEDVPPMNAPASEATGSHEVDEAAAQQFGRSLVPRSELIQLNIRMKQLIQEAPSHYHTELYQLQHHVVKMKFPNAFKVIKDMNKPKRQRQAKTRTASSTGPNETEDGAASVGETSTN
jgi:hypothetical protein